MFRQKNMKIHYRPDLSKTLQKIMNDTLQLYKQNQIVMLYTLLAKIYIKNEDTEGAKLLFDAAKCLLKNDFFCDEEFIRKYQKDLNKLGYNLGDITETQAAGIMFKVYEDAIIRERNTIDETGFTGMEHFMIDKFFHMLLSPTRNPNLQVKEGHIKCYYEEQRFSDFLSDLKLSIEFIQENGRNTIELFNTPDEDLKIDEFEQEKELEKE